MSEAEERYLKFKNHADYNGLEPEITDYVAELKQENQVLINEQCFHSFILNVNGYETIVCKKCGKGYSFENRRPSHIDAPQNKDDTDRFFTFTEWYSLKQENQELTSNLKRVHAAINRHISQKQELLFVLEDVYNLVKNDYRLPEVKRIIGEYKGEDNE